VVYQGTRVIGQSTVQRAYRAQRAASAGR